MKRLLAVILALASFNIMACPQFNFDNLKCTFEVGGDSFEYAIDRLSNTAAGNGYLLSATFEGSTVEDTIPSTVTDESGLTTITSCEGHKIVIQEEFNGESARQEMSLAGNGLVSTGSQLIEVEVCDENDQCTITFEKEDFTNTCRI